MAKNPNWSDEELIILESLYGKLMCKDIVEYLPGRSVNSILLKGREQGLKSNRSFTRKVYGIDYDYFCSPDINNSYWAGFIAADGGISTTKKGNVRISLSAIDEHHLLRFKSDCKYEGKIYRFTQNGRNYASINLCGVNKWVSDLEHNYSITPRKTKTLKPPTICGVNALSFIKGYIDGDGCIFTEQPPRGQRRIGLALVGTQDLLSWVKYYTDTTYHSQYDSNVRPLKGSDMFQYKIVGAHAMGFLSRLDEIDTPRLDRKWNKIKELTYETI